MTSYCTACIAGYENLTAWADLLDRINVFPVADGDTGTNLRISLAPLRACESGMASAVTVLAGSGRGNSGNIAVAFFREFLNPAETGLAGRALAGRDLAWKSIADPRSGTMLGVFDSLCRILDGASKEILDFPGVQKQLRHAVFETEQQISELEEAGVVDAGALGMFIFFDGFFRKLILDEQELTPVTELFAEKLHIRSSFQPQFTDEHCVEALLSLEGKKHDVQGMISELGSSAVIVEDNSAVKLHLHTRNPEKLRSDLSSLGEVVNWSDEAMDPMICLAQREKFTKNTIRIMSDAAGSIPFALAGKHGIIMLDSYITAGEQSLPESLFSPEILYSLLKQGRRVTTAQASMHERHLHYEAACEQYDKILYLSTGSSFTGNYSAVLTWKKENDPADRLTVIDTGAASGRLAVIALLTARLAEQGAAAETVMTYAKELTMQAEEFVFINEMKYLVAGGRASRTKGFFADLLHMKPVVSPDFEGVRKVGVLRNSEDQLDFAIAKLKKYESRGAGLFVLLQYSDNKKWLAEIVKPRICRQVPDAEVLLVPLSLTSGVHMGPGTWSIALHTEGKKHD